jgi:hypothetical protein
MIVGWGEEVAVKDRQWAAAWWGGGRDPGGSGVGEAEASW